MIAIICIDERGGLLFNKRRLSFDSILIDRILEMTEGASLWMDPYSASLFPKKKIRADADFMDLAEKGEYCFIENCNIAPFAEKIEKWIIYNWNRRYPSDFKFDFSLLDGKNSVSCIDFEGNSHLKITEEIYQ